LQTPHALAVPPHPSQPSVGPLHTPHALAEPPHPSQPPVGPLQTPHEFTTPEHPELEAAQVPPLHTDPEQQSESCPQAWPFWAHQHSVSSHT
jgi:hypothetical protein